jgi:hypothetical protein
VSAPKVFISYSHQDADWVRQFAEALRNEHVDVWLDQWQLKAGDFLPDVLGRGLRESDAIVVLLSSSNVRRPSVFFELGAALGTGKKLIPVLDKDVDQSTIPFNLRTRQYLIKGSPSETAIEVASAVKAA